MKKFSVFLLASLLSFGISLHAQDTPELIEDKIVFADYEEYTSLISSLALAPTQISPLVFEIGGYRFTFDKGNGRIMRDRSERTMVLPKSTIQIERLDGNVIRSIYINVSTSSSPYDVTGYTPITNFRGSVDGIEVQDWYNVIQFNSTSITITALDSKFGSTGGNCYYFTGITIKRENGEPKAQMKMDFTIDKATAVGARTAVIDFTLSVTNDDGIRDFTITATDEDGEERGNRTFTRAELEETTPANIEDDEASNDDSNYTLHGRMELTNLKKNERQNLTFALVANYDNDRESVPCSTTPIYEVNTIGATAIDDIIIDANEPIEYFNLQGIKVSNPTGGIFIVKRGTTATKTRIQ